MVFSSNIFLFYFLPIVLGIYYLAPFKYRNLVLFIASLCFYFVGENRLVILFFISILFHYLWAKLLDKYHNKYYLIIGIAFDLGLLAYFKYTNFFIENFNHLLNLNINILKVTLPIGISFFTFQGMSYLIDVYNHKVEVSKSFINFGAYLALFPQLIAGPIVRYEDVEKELVSRKENIDDFSKGVQRFVIGLAKKVLIADSLAIMIKNLEAMISKTVLSHILEALAISFQLYFDFSAYSDMAIGLGLLFGFHFLENFKYPLFAHSVTDFWRKWHISLSSWFKDYVYIPLGGSRVKPYRHIINLLIVWFLTGFWHGAEWNFILWGMYFGIILIIEKFFFKGFFDRHRVIGWFYTFTVVCLGFVLFHFSNMQELGQFILNMFGLGNLPLINYETSYYLSSYSVLLVCSFIGASPILKTIYLKLQASSKQALDILEPIFILIILCLSISYIISASFSPFLYFRF